MKKKKLGIILILIAIVLTTGCTTQLKDSKKKPVTNPETGQNLTENILCRPTNKETIEIYKKHKVDINKLPECEDFKITSGGYSGIWESIFVKPLAFIILWLSKYVGSAGLALIITSILIRLIAYPITRKTAIQSELIKKAQPELDRIEKKYTNKQDQDSLMRKSQEMTLVYKKYKINPLAGCLYAFIQLPLFMAFLEAINRVPALFEEKFLRFLQLGTTPMTGVPRGEWSYIILVILIAVTTYFSFKLNSTSTQSQPQMKYMPLMMVGMIVLMSLFMPAALGLYWITTNLFTVVQNLIVKRSKVLNDKA